jgi:hypothetical protein
MSAAGQAGRRQHVSSVLLETYFAVANKSIHDRPRLFSPVTSGLPSFAIARNQTMTISNSLWQWRRL